MASAGDPLFNSSPTAQKSNSNDLHPKERRKTNSCRFQEWRVGAAASEVTLSNFSILHFYSITLLLEPGTKRRKSRRNKRKIVGSGGKTECGSRGSMEIGCVGRWIVVSTLGENGHLFRWERPEPRNGPTGTCSSGCRWLDPRSFHVSTYLDFCWVPESMDSYVNKGSRLNSGTPLQQRSDEIWCGPLKTKPGSSCWKSVYKHGSSPLLPSFVNLCATCRKDMLIATTSMSDFELRITFEWRYS